MRQLLKAAMVVTLLASADVLLAQAPPQVDQPGIPDAVADSIMSTMFGSDTGPPMISSDVDTSLIDDWRAGREAYYRYQVFGAAHRKSVFEWQLLSSKIIFFAVLILVFVGTFFSGVQFYRAMDEKDGESSEERSADVESMRSELELSPEGVKVSSPVIGVIILVISLAFFYLYLVYVYPIEEIF